MINFIDTVLDGSPTFKFTYDDNTTATNVKIELENDIQTLGTAMNKALFDSIADDLNSRLLISNKASNAEAKAGTNDTKYMTPAKVQTKLQTLTTRATQTHSGDTRTTYTLLGNVSNQVIDIFANISAGNGSSNYASVTFNGTGLKIESTVDSLTSATATSVPLQFFSTTKQTMHLRIDTYSKTITGNLYRLYTSTGTPSVETIAGNFTTLTSIEASLKSASSIVYSVKYDNLNPNA